MTNPISRGTISRRGLLAAAGAVGAAAVAGAAAPAAAAASTSTGFDDRVRSFVRVRRGEFWLAGRPWRFGGTNCYYLHQKSHYMIDSMLNDAKQMGLAAVRAWAFADGTEKPEKPLQPEPYTYDEEAFDSLDYAVHKAGQLGLRLVLPLVNNWPDYGGMQQYVQWFLGLPDDSYGEGVNHDRFYTTRTIEDCYRAYVRHVVTRRNTYTGRRYNADPTIMTWELANEPRSRSQKDGVALEAWADRTSRLLKRLAPRQLVAVGDEGHYGRIGDPDYPYSDYEGAHWPALTSLPAVDYGTVHLYPDAWKGELTSEQKRAWGTQWVRDHIVDGRALGKPVVLEEYGIRDQAIRDATYADWTGVVESEGGAGDQFWILTARQDDGELYPDYDGFRVVYPSSTATLLAAHARRMSAQT